MILQRNTILSALFSLVSQTQGINSFSRRLMPWSSPASAFSQPALFQRYVGDHHAPLVGFGQPQMITMHVEIWLYAKQNGPDSIPEDTFTPLLDALDTALAAGSTFDGRQTLGMPDIVQHVWREGESTYSSGELGDQIVCLAPLRIWTGATFGTA